MRRAYQNFIQLRFASLKFHLKLLLCSKDGVHDE